MKNSQCISHRKEKPSLSNITKRKRRESFLESNNPSADNSCVTEFDQQWISSPELNWNNEINGLTNEVDIKMQRNIQCLPDSSGSTSEPAAACINQIQGNDDFQLQKTVYDADMDLTAVEVSKIVTVSKGTKNKSNKKLSDCGIKTFRKVKDSSSEKKRERSKRQFKNHSDMNVEEKIENEPQKRSAGLNGKGNLEDPDFAFKSEHLTQLNTRKTMTLHNGFDRDDKRSTETSEKKRMHVTNEQEETYPSSQSPDKFQQDSKFDMGQSSLAYNKSKASRQTFVIHKLEEGNLFLNQKDKETISENLEVTNEFQTADLATKHNGNLCDYVTQSMLDLTKHVTDIQTVQQNDSKINKKHRQKVNRKTEVISEMKQIYGDSDKDMPGPEKCNFSFQTQEDKEVISRNLEVPDEFQKPASSTSNNRNLCACEPENVLGFQKSITDIFPVRQNESKVNNNLRQKVNRKTVILSEVNHLCNDKNVYCPQKDNPFFLTQKDKEIIPENLEDPSEFQTLGFSTQGSENLYDFETQNVLGVKKHVHGMQPTCQNESKIDTLRRKVCRKTEIVSEINQMYRNDGKGKHDPEKGNLFSITQKDKEIIPENLEDSNEFQVANPSTRDNRNFYDYETQNILGEKKHDTDMPPIKQNGSKINKRHRHKGSGKTEIILEMNRVSEFNNKDVHDPDKGNLFSLTPKDKEIIPENPEVTNEFQTCYLSTKDNGNSYDCETQNVLDLKKHVTDKQLAQQNVSKVNQLRQNVNRKTEIISEMYPVYGNNDKDVHGQESYKEDLDFKINESKQRFECQDSNNGYYMEINSNEKEKCDQISNPYKQVKKHGKGSDKAKNILAKGKNKPILQLTDSSQTSLSLESGLKHATNEVDYDSGNQIETHKNLKENTTTLSEERDSPFVEVIKGECQVKRVNKVRSKSKKRKTFIDPSPHSHEAMEIISDPSQGISVEAEEADEEKNLKHGKIKPDCYTQTLNSLSQIYPPNIQDSSLISVHEGSRPMCIPSSKNLIIKENFALESSPIFQVSDDLQEKMTGMKFNVTQRMQKSGAGRSIPEVIKF